MAAPESEFVEPNFKIEDAVEEESPEEPESDGVESDWAGDDPLAYQGVSSGRNRIKPTDRFFALTSLLLGACAFLCGMIPLLLRFGPSLPEALADLAWVPFVFVGIGGTLLTFVLSAIARGRRGREIYIVLARVFAFAWIAVLLVYRFYSTGNTIETYGAIFVCLVFMIPIGFIMLNILDGIFDS